MSLKIYRNSLSGKNSDKLFGEESITVVKVTEKLVNKAHDVNV